jgi:uncharacterized BrkB/YihY/UPF0761 family membrane protein
VFVGAYEDNILFLGSALTFDALLASLPFALLLLATLGYFVHSGEQAMADVIVLLDRVLPAGADSGDGPLRRAEDLIAGVVESRGQLSSFGIPLFLWFATRFFSGTRAALNEIFDTHESRSAFRGKAVDLSLVVVTLVLLMANAFLTVRFADDPWIGRFVIGLSTYGLGVALFVIVYKAAPTRTNLSEFATIDRLISNTNAIAVLLLVVWVYAMAVIFLVGAEVAETYDLMRRQREQRAILG